MMIMSRFYVHLQGNFMRRGLFKGADLCQLSEPLTRNFLLLAAARGYKRHNEKETFHLKGSGIALTSSVEVYSSTAFKHY